MKGELAMLYRALRPLGLFPPVIDRMTLWQCAVLLDEDIDPESGLVLPDGTPAPPSGGDGPLGLSLVSIDPVGEPDV